MSVLLRDRLWLLGSNEIRCWPWKYVYFGLVCMIMSLNIKENHSNLTLQYSFHCPIYIVAEPDPTVFGWSRRQNFGSSSVYKSSCSSRLSYGCSSCTVLKSWTFYVVNHWVLHGHCDRLRNFLTLFCVINWRQFLGHFQVLIANNFSILAQEN